jgi:hypothetical protein
MLQMLMTFFRNIVVSPCWGYRFMTQMWLSDDAKEKLCRSNVTFISDQSTTAWQVARWRRVETLISGLNPPGCSPSQIWCDSRHPSGTLGLLYSFPSMPCAFLRAGVLENKLQVSHYAIWYRVCDILLLLTWQDTTTRGFFWGDLVKETGELDIYGNL